MTKKAEMSDEDEIKTILDRMSESAKAAVIPRFHELCAGDYKGSLLGKFQQAVRECADFAPAITREPKRPDSYYEESHRLHQAQLLKR